MPATKPAAKSNSPSKWNIYAAAGSDADLSAFQGIGRCPDCFTPAAVGTIVVKRHCDDVNQTFTSWPAGKTIFAQCSALVSTTVEVKFDWLE